MTEIVATAIGRAQERTFPSPGSPERAARSVPPVDFAILELPFASRLWFNLGASGKDARVVASPAIVLANGLYRTAHGKTAHGLVRGSSRFTVLAVVDPTCAGQDAGMVLDGKHRGIPIVPSLAAALAHSAPRPEFCVVGIATHGGKLSPELRQLLRAALDAGLSVVNGLHEYASDDADLVAAAARAGVTITDVRRPKPKSELHFFSGAINRVRAPRLALLGMDCAVGKRTTARLLVEACREHGIAAEMIYTGQTGWMQGVRYGLVLDSIVNDFVCGELEHAIVQCDADLHPDLIVLEGQSALRNPSGPCGAELLLAGGARGVVLQHAPGRRYYDGHEQDGYLIPPVADEIRLIALYGARTLAVTLNGEGLDAAALVRAQQGLEQELGIAVVRPLEEGLSRLLPIVRSYLAEAAP
ncbi:MAG: DUF1611 domain-containing protein [Planctomycetota bacterium]